MVSAHKLGGPRGIGALVLAAGEDREALLRGGGQESGRRAGTENLAAIAGFAAAAAAAQRDLAGEWPSIWPKCAIICSTGWKMPRNYYVSGARIPAPAADAVHPDPRVEGRDAGDADGPGRLCRFRRVRLFFRQSPGKRGPARDGRGRAECRLRVARLVRGTTTLEDLDRFAHAWLAARARWQGKQGR